MEISETIKASERASDDPSRFCPSSSCQFSTVNRWENNSNSNRMARALILIFVKNNVKKS